MTTGPWAQPPDSMRAATILAEEMAKQLRVAVPPKVLHDWIKARWHTVHRLAHNIHDGYERKATHTAAMIVADEGSGP